MFEKLKRNRYAARKGLRKINSTYGNNKVRIFYSNQNKKRYIIVPNSSNKNGFKMIEVTEHRYEGNTPRNYYYIWLTAKNKVQYNKQRANNAARKKKQRNNKAAANKRRLNALSPENRNRYNKGWALWGGRWVSPEEQYAQR